MDNSSALRQEICEIGKLLYDKGMIAGTEGNISCRTDTGEILITPGGKCKGMLIPGDLVLLSLGGVTLESTKVPSSEYRVHLAGYRARSEFAAAVHAHPPFSTAFAAAGLPIESTRLPEFSSTFGEIPLTPFAAPGSVALAEALERVIAKGHTFLFENHGLISFGANLQEALYRLEMAERCAEIIWLSRQLVKPRGFGRTIAAKPSASSSRKKTQLQRKRRS